MKVKVEIEEITKKELTTLFDIDVRFQLTMPAEVSFRDQYYDSNLSRTENCAKALEKGYAIGVVDYNADDELDAYGYLPHDYIANVGVLYKLTLFELKLNLARALNHHPELWEYVSDWVCSEGSALDANSADVLMQYIVFGEVVYG